MTRPRILLFTGKGGVGKTVIAAATAVRAAERGYRTLVVSSDPAHSLSDALEHDLVPEPEEVEGNLLAQEIDVYYSLGKYWGPLRDYILQVFRWQKVDALLAEELAVFPGLEEGAAFLWVEKFFGEGEFDLIIIDCAPTAETLRLLSLPQVGRWWMERIFPVQRKVIKQLGPMVRMMSDVPVPEDETYAAVENLYERLLKMHDILTDPDVSSIRLVINPEHMVIQEARRMYTCLGLYGYPVDAAIVNRILGEDSSGSLGHYLEAQERHLQEIEEAFAPLPLFRVPHLGREVFGIPLLRKIAEELYAEKDPADIFLKNQPYSLKSRDGAYLLEVHLSFLGKEDVSVTQYGDELVIQVRNQRRNFFLPRFLAYYDAVSARLEEGRLRVVFEPRNKDASA